MEMVKSVEGGTEKENLAIALRVNHCKQEKGMNHREQQGELKLQEDSIQG